MHRRDGTLWGNLQGGYADSERYYHIRVAYRKRTRLGLTGNFSSVWYIRNDDDEESRLEDYLTNEEDAGYRFENMAQMGRSSVLANVITVSHEKLDGLDETSGLDISDDMG